MKTDAAKGEVTQGGDPFLRQLAGLHGQAKGLAKRINKLDHQRYLLTAASRLGDAAEEAARGDKNRAVGSLGEAVCYVNTIHAALCGAVAWDVVAAIDNLNAAVYKTWAAATDGPSSGRPLFPGYPGTSVASPTGAKLETLTA